jgi:hypothetical protein
MWMRVEEQSTQERMAEVLPLYGVGTAHTFYANCADRDSC